MLVLTRRLGQSIIITDPKTGDKITVTVADVRGDQVRVGVQAPRHLTVDRAEVAARKDAEKRPERSADRNLTI